MKTRRIPMVGAMVRATREDRKTHTRRVGDFPPDTKAVRWVEDHETVPGGRYTGWVVECGAPLLLPRACPYGVVGDRLRVLETWAVGKCADGLKPLELHPGTWMKDNGGLWYAADDATPAHPISERGKWRPGRFMPGQLDTWPSRITLEITEVRVERLQSITREDALAEGVEDGFGGQYFPGYLDMPASVANYRRLWDTLNEKRGHPWSANDWVWVIAFKRLAQGALAA